MNAESRKVWRRIVGTAMVVPALVLLGAPSDLFILTATLGFVCALIGAVMVPR